MKVRTFQRGHRWWLDYFWKGERVRRPVADTEGEASIEASKIVLAVSQKTYPGPDAWHGKEDRPEVHGDTTVREFSKEYLKLHAAQKKASSFYDHTVKVIVAEIGDKPMRTVTAKDAQALLAARRQKVKTATANRTLAVAKHMFRMAVEWGYADSNPFLRLKPERERNRREFFVTAEQAEALLAKLPPYLRPVTVVALHTGARQGELLGLRWEDVDLERRLVAFRNTKNGEDRTGPLSRKATETLKRLETRLKGGEVFRNTLGEPLTKEALRNPFVKAVRDAGLRGFVFHDLRHSAASFMVQAGVPLNTVRQVLGHKSIAMTLRYAHLGPDHLTTAADAMDRVSSKPGGTGSGTTAASEI